MTDLTSAALADVKVGEIAIIVGLVGAAVGVAMKAWPWLAHLTPRPWRHVGKRGQILLVFGFLWLGTGVGTIASPQPEAWDEVPLLRDYPAGWAWIAAGLLAMAYAVRPERVTHDGIAFVALYLPPAYRAGAYVLAWVDSLTPLGAVGHPRGWLSALIYLGLVAAVLICSSWPEPPEREHRDCHG